ncbi:hypothetical protein WJX79_000770 [Trebouxia sp. C0005]
MSQSIVTAVCNVSGAAYSRLHLNAVAKRVLPEHTRDALFQLFCDARTNTPKDQVFFMRHAEALKPHTFTGWLAMLAALLYSASGFALFSVGALGLMATVAFTSIFFAVIGGIIFATFVGVVATTLSLASIGLVAVASGAGTTAAAGYLTFNFWKIVFQRLGFVRQRAHLTSSGQQALPTSSQHTYTTGDTGRNSSGLGRSQGPTYTSLSSGTLGENTRQPTHNKLTTEPAKDPLKKDISIGDDESSDILGKSPSSPSSIGANSTGTSEGVDSAFGSAISQDSNVRDFMEGALTNKPSKQSQGGSPSDPSLETSPFKTSGGAGSNGQHSSTGSQGGPPSKTGGDIKSAGQKDGASSQDESPFKTGGKSGSGKGSSTVTTGAPPLSQKQATNDQDINDIFGSGGSHAAPNTVQTGGGPGQRSGQGSAQSGGQRSSQSGGQSGGQSASKPSSGTPSSDSTSSGSAATNFGQATNDSEINDLFSKGGSHTAQSSANPFSGLDSSGLPSSGPRDSGTESSGPQDSRSRSSGSHASGVDGSGPRPSGSSAPVRPDSNKPTNDSSINAIFGKPATPNGQNASRGAPGPNGQNAPRGSSGPNDSAFGGDFGGFGRQDIGLQSNFRGPTGQQGPQGSSGPRGSSRHY